jgi:hypothetical protein
MAQSTRLLTSVFAALGDGRHFGTSCRRTEKPGLQGAAEWTLDSARAR